MFPIGNIYRSIAFERIYNNKMATDISFQTVTAFQKRKAQMLILSLLFDSIGMLSYLVPGFAEFADIAWAPLAGIIYFAMYRGILGVVGGSFTFLEEIVPFTDVVPSFTLTWLYVYVIREAHTKAHYHREAPAIQSVQAVK